MQKLHKFVLLDFFHSTCRGIEQLQDLWLVPTYKVCILWIFIFTKKNFPKFAMSTLPRCSSFTKLEWTNPASIPRQEYEYRSLAAKRRHKKTGAPKPVISRGPYNSTFWGGKKNSETHWFFRPFIRVITPLCRLCSSTLLQHLSEGRIQLLSSSDPRSGVTKQFPPLSGYGGWLVHVQIHSTSFNIIQPFNS